MNRKVHFFDFVFLLRPTLFYPIWTFFLAGLWGGKSFGNDALLYNAMSIVHVISGLTLLMGGVFILNQTQDVETDRANNKLFLLANGIISISFAYIEAGLLIAISLVLGFMFDIRIGIGFIVLLFLSGYLYNYPPTRWKNHPIMGLLINGFGGAVIYSLGWITAGGDGWMPVRVIAYALAGVAVFLNTTLPDVEGDRKTGKITFGVRYGVESTAIWAFILEFLTIALALIFYDRLLLIPACIVFPLFIWAAKTRTIADITRATKFSVLALAISVCVAFPWYIIPVFIVFYGSRLYYKKRFNFDYPSFKTS